MQCHAIEHLEMAKDEYSDHGREFDDGDHSITWKEGISLFYMSPEFTRLPPVYNYASSSESVG
jgi:hypothetical protein